MNQYNTMHRVKYKKVLYMVVIVNASACGCDSECECMHVYS